MSARLGLLLLLAWLVASPAAAGPNADLVFWQSIRAPGTVAEYRAYLDAFPNGTFAALARIRIQALTPAEPSNAAPVPVAPIASLPATAAPAAPREAAAQAILTVLQPQVRAIDRIPVDLDARPLSGGSNFRLVTVPAGTPDALDAETIDALGLPVGPKRLRLTLGPADHAGSNEVRLYEIPRYAAAFTIAARAKVEVAPAAAGSVVVASLVREARALGAVGFEAKYRDRSLRVDGQFLRLVSGTASADLADLLRGTWHDPTRYVILYLGHLGTPSASGSGPAEVACVLPAEDRRVLERIAALRPGSEVVVDGSGTTWGALRGDEAVLLDPCRLAS
ncbi:hypothetical protein [Mangrovibrevibacter kandeliae]|uniref:hypothetical protein n=1 Tax=Mangrovibrevibacter kandeliae TaxID=2968473 RepID=UPI002117D727|nr:hypothetical protein [Aurantimonas sp. CSK15Z-1]MCQ8783595.1 hypothetical protein [Aurantimonas sp. CSK15Z-1]